MKGGALKKQREAVNDAGNCVQCETDLNDSEKALFVEEENGRVFCSEKCIVSFFGSDIERLEKEYFAHLTKEDLNATKRKELLHLRWNTLKDPQEIWREKTLKGDYRYTLVSKYSESGEDVWCVCICLFLRGEPSFLFLAFVTKREEMVSHYRKGERVVRVDIAEDEREKDLKEAGIEISSQLHIDHAGAAQSGPSGSEAPSDGVARQNKDDIPIQDHAMYEELLETTLQDPDEVWNIDPKSKEQARLYHFVKHYADEQQEEFWYVVVARETEDHEQIEIIDAFPTKDQGLVSQYRTGLQEISRDSDGEGGESPPDAGRIVH